MTRRVLALLGGGAALLALSSCATFDTENAATVNGTDISIDNLDQFRDELAANPASFQLGSENFDAAGAPDGDLTRQALTLLIANAVLSETLAAAGTPVTDEQLANAVSELGASDDSLPEAAKDALAYQSAASAALANVPAPDPASLEATYNRQPAATGAVCLVIVQTASEADADAAAATLRSGQAVVATDTIQVEDGCAPVTGLSQAFAGDDLSFFLDAGPGDVSRVFPPDPVNGTTSWQVIEIESWADALEQFTATLTQSPGELAVAATFVTADISVASEYGEWDAATQSVVALTPAPEAASPA